MNEEKTVEQEFYQACAKLLGAQHEYQPYPYRRRNRWNNRRPGNGRYPGFGVIRLYGDRAHVQLRAPIRISLWCSHEEALELLKTITPSRSCAS